MPALRADPTAPTLAGLAAPTAARWSGPRRLRARLGEALALSASASGPLWLRARGAAGPAQWLPFAAAAGGAARVEWTPARTGITCLELALETAPGRVALVPGAVVEAMVEHPQFAGLRAYTLIPRVSGPLAGWAQRLPALRSLGFNAIWLLPLCAPGRSRSPYSTGDPMAVDPALAPDGDGWKEAEAFADACRREGIALGVDLVLNHVAPDGPFAAAHPHWLAPGADEADGLQRSGWWEGAPPHGRFHAWQDLVRLRLERIAAADRAELLAWFGGYALRWAGLAARSAAPLVRLDNVHSTPEPLLEAVLPALRAAHPDLSVLAEFFDDRPGAAEEFAWRHGIERLLATPWMDPYASQQRHLLRYLDEVAATSATRYFIPLCSHDSGSAVQAYGGTAALAARYLALAVLGGGCTGCVQGTEWSTPHKVEFIGPPGEYPRAASQAEMLRRVHAVLEAEGPIGPAPTRWLDAGHGATLCGERLGRRPLLVVANLDATGGHDLAVPEGCARWTPLLSHGCRIEGGRFHLEPGGHAVYAEPDA